MVIIKKNRQRNENFLEHQFCRPDYNKNAEKEEFIYATLTSVPSSANSLPARRTFVYIFLLH